MTERTKKSIEILLNAYNNDKLVGGRCETCLCGNLVEANYQPEGGKINHVAWALRVADKFEDVVIDEGFDQILSTGFSLNEFTILEQTFEYNYRTKVNEPSKLPLGIQMKVAALFALTKCVKVMLDFDKQEAKKKIVLSNAVEQLELCSSSH